MLKLALLVLAVAACSPSPTPSPSAGPPTAAPPTAGPSVAATSVPTTEPTQATVTLPAGFERIPWANIEANTHIVSIGVLGRPASTTRVSVQDDAVYATGSAVIVRTSRTIDEVVDAATGQTIATFDVATFRLQSPPWTDPNRENPYAYAPQGFQVDVDRGYLYDMSSNADGVQLRRFRLDGSEEARLLTLAPDPAKDFWDQVGFVLGQKGEIVAVACPSERSPISDHRCRLWRVPPGAAPPFDTAYLPAKAPRPCFLVGVSERFLVASSYVACHADGGAPEQIPYMSIDLANLATRVVTAESNMTRMLVDDSDGVARFIGNLQAGGPWPVAYPALAVQVTLDQDYFATDTLFSEERPGWVWALRGAGPGWYLRQSFGPDYAACRLSTESPIKCPLGPVVLDVGRDSFGLPAGTYGEIAPPLEFLDGF